jgi:hypothetical protein
MDFRSMFRAKAPERIAAPRPPAALPEQIAESVAVRAREADTDGRLRRMRQTVEDNRFL